MKKAVLPVQIYFGLTYGCNLRCEHCYVDKVGYKEKTTDEIKNTLKKLSDRGVMKVYFSHGESLLRKDLENIISYCTEIGLYTILLTNGILLKEERAQKIKEAGVGKITISLDSLDFAYHDKMRGVPGSWEGAVKAMDICRYLGIKFGVNTTINSSSTTKLKEMVDFAVSKKANDIFFLTIRPESKKDYENFKTIDNYPKIIEEIWRLKKEYTNKITISFHDPLAIAILKDKVDKKDLPVLLRENICNAGKLWGSVLPTGEVQPCNFLPVSIGNVYRDDFDDIWNKNNLNKKMYFSLPVSCSHCEVSNSCKGGCKSFSFASENNSRDFRCKL